MTLYTLINFAIFPKKPKNGGKHHPHLQHYKRQPSERTDWAAALTAGLFETGGAVANLNPFAWTGLLEGTHCKRCESEDS